MLGGEVLDAAGPAQLALGGAQVLVAAGGALASLLRNEVPAQAVPHLLLLSPDGLPGLPVL